jgi:hypothetical protein
MMQGFIMEVAGCAAGLLVREQKRFRFSAVSRAPKSLEGRSSQSVEEAQSAVDAVVAAKQWQGQGPAVGVSRRIFQEFVQYTPLEGSWLMKLSLS